LRPATAIYASGVGVELREISDQNWDEVLALRLAPGQDRFVGSVAECLDEASEYPNANPWCRAVYDGDTPVGFVMVSWNVEPDPPEIIGPWFLWKLIVDERHQRKGYGSEVVRRIADLVRAEGADELLTSYTEGDGEPGPFYRRLGFEPTGERDSNGEVILALALQSDL
jgi:diamine N-acetyltransferase